MKDELAVKGLVGEAEFKRGQHLCLWSHLRGMNLAEQYPPTLELAHAYSIHAPVMGLVAHFNRGIAYAQKSRATYASLGDVWGQGQALNAVLPAK